MSKQLFDELVSELQAGNNELVESKLCDLSDEQIDALFGEAQAFKSLGPATCDRVVLASVSNLRQQYLKKLITTAMVGFLFQMKDEYTVDEEELANPPNKEDFMVEVSSNIIPDDFDQEHFYKMELRKAFSEKCPGQDAESREEMETAIGEDALLEVAAKFAEHLKKLHAVEQKLDMQKYNEAIQSTVREESDRDRAVISKFLTNLFTFNKDKHLKEGHNPTVGDPERQDLEELKGTHAVYDNVPPNDTHCRFTKYFDINYEKMREATKNIYNVKPDLEHAMIVYDIVDSQEDANAFIGKYGSSSKYDIVSFNLNKWTLMGPFKENRERVDYYNKHNQVIKALLEQQEEDNLLGEDMMKKRVKSTKVKAEKVFGKDSPQFGEYKKLVGSMGTDDRVIVEDVDEKTVKVVKETVVDTCTGEELTLDEDGVPTNALEVPVTTINAKTGEVKQSRIFTRADDKK